jgi:O-antigen ligase
MTSAGRMGVRPTKRRQPAASIAPASAAPRVLLSHSGKRAGAVTWALGLYIAVVVGRIHESVPILAKLYLGKVAALMLAIALVLEARELPFARAFGLRASQCLLIITVIGVLSIPGSAWPGGGLIFLREQWPLLVLLFFAVVVAFSDMRTATSGIQVLTVVGGLGAIQLLSGAGLSDDGRMYIGGGSSSTYDPNYTATFFVMVLPYAIMFASRPGRLRWLMAALVPALTGALISTGSRGGIVALATMVLALMGFSDRRFRKRHAAFLVIGVGVMLMMPNSQVIERFQSLTSGGDYNFESRDGRLEIWRRGLGMMFTHPVFGVGIKAYEMASGFATGSWMNAHNALIQIGAELGLIALVAFVTAVVSSIRHGLRVRRACAASNDERVIREGQLATASVTSLVSVFVAAQFLSMAFDAMTLFAIAVPSGLALALKAEEVLSAKKVPTRQRAMRPAASIRHQG